MRVLTLGVVAQIALVLIVWTLSLGLSYALGFAAGRSSVLARDCVAFPFDGAVTSQANRLIEAQNAGYQLVSNEPGGSGDIRLLVLCR